MNESYLCVDNILNSSLNVGLVWEGDLVKMVQACYRCCHDQQIGSEEASEQRQRC
jgi:hypothetical protein